METVAAPSARRRAQFEAVRARRNPPFKSPEPRSILYDNTRLAVARILGDGTRQRTRILSELQSH
jgi:hypothetical protein